MTIAVTGEGPTDYGKEKVTVRGAEWNWGAAAAYIENIACEKNVEITLVPISRHEIEKFRMSKKRTGGLSGKGFPAAKFRILAEMKDIHRGIYYCDADKSSGTKNSSEHALKKRFRLVYDEIKRGLAQDDENANDFIPMIALRMIECWMMGDPDALAKVFENGINVELLPRRPEIIWGDSRDPKSNHPKHLLQRIINTSDNHKRTIDTDISYQIAKASDTTTMERRCPISFPVFERDLSALLKSIKRETTEMDDDKA